MRNCDGAPAVSRRDAAPSSEKVVSTGRKGVDYRRPVLATNAAVSSIAERPAPTTSPPASASGPRQRQGECAVHKCLLPAQDWSVRRVERKQRGQLRARRDFERSLSPGSAIKARSLERGQTCDGTNRSIPSHADKITRRRQIADRCLPSVPGQKHPKRRRASWRAARALRQPAPPRRRARQGRPMLRLKRLE